MKRPRGDSPRSSPRPEAAAETFHIVWSESACKDLEDIIDYLASQESLAAASKVHQRVLDAIESLAKLPIRCRLVPELKEMGIRDFRELIVSPYRICFRIRADRVVLVGVLDGRRDLEEALISRTLPG